MTCLCRPVPGVTGLQALPNSGAQEIRCVRSWQLTGKRSCTRVIARVQRRGVHSRGLSHIMARVCNAAKMISWQKVKLGEHHILLRRVVLEGRCVSRLHSDDTDQLCGPDLCGRHVSTVLGGAPEFHAVVHARRNTGSEDKQGRCRSPSSAAQERRPLMQRRQAIGTASR